MKVRIPTPGTALGARLTALCGCALTVLALVTVSACSGSSSTPTVPTFSPTGSPTAPATGGATVTASGSDGTSGSGPPGDTSNVPAQTATAFATATATVTITVPPSSQIPTVAPVTGGGGTAGPQDLTLFGLGAAAIVFGAGSLAYRRWLNRGR